MTNATSNQTAATPAEIQAMNDAIDRALQARSQSGKAGIAATVLHGGQVIATGENEVQLQNDPSKHAEIVALGQAGLVRGGPDLSGCVLISTLQPCEMCLAAMRFAGIGRVIFAARQEDVAAKYFVFPHLHIRDFAKGGGFVHVGGVQAARVLRLYRDGAE